MTGTTAQRHRPANVPRLALPCPDTTVTAWDVDSPAFRRQINVALGRSHSQRTPRRDVIFNVRHGRMLEKQKVPLATTIPPSHGLDMNDNSLSIPSSQWITSNQSVAPAFSPSAIIEPKGRWYEHADKVFRFFGYVVNPVEPTARQVPANVRLMSIHYYPQDATLEMIESKKTAPPGISRAFTRRQPSRVSLHDIQVGSDVLVFGTRIHVYDADGFTRRSIPGLRPPERPPITDTTSSITPRRGPAPQSQHSLSERAGYCGSPARTNDGGGTGGGGTGSSLSTGVWPSWDIGSFSALSQEDPPPFLRMYIRWDENGGGAGPVVHRYILHYFLEDSTLEMRELADANGGDHFEGRFPVMIRRQKVFKGGRSPSLSADRIGGDRANIGRRTSRSATVDGAGGCGAGIADDADDVGLPLTPLDLGVGRQVLLMKRPMTVCGWDETAHAWWESCTGTSMRGLQEDLEDFQRCVRPIRTQPRPPNKSKSSFYEGPPQRPGTLRERFSKASENSGKTLRFLAKATDDTKTTSTRDNLFIIRFYPEDDTLSVYTSHTLGNNAGGLFKGIYLSRSSNIINKDTGEAFKASDFHIGSVAKLPSISLEVIDIDDFSRYHLAQETPPTDCHWQTAHMWAKLLSAATAAGAAAAEEVEISPIAAAAAAEGGHHLAHARFGPRSPAKSVMFGSGGGGAGNSNDNGNGNDNGDSGDAKYLRPDGGTVESFSRDSTAGCGILRVSSSFAPTADNQCGGGGGGGDDDDGRSRRSWAVFARLWHECIGNDAVAAIAFESAHGGSGGCLVSGCGSGAEISAHDDPATPRPSPRRQQLKPSPLSDQHSLGPWEQLVAALRADRGIDVYQVLTVHERTLLEKEIADWILRVQGRRGQRPGTVKGRAARLEAAAAALRQKSDDNMAPAVGRIAGRPGDAAGTAQNESRSAGEYCANGPTPPPAAATTADAAEEESGAGGVGGIPNTYFNRPSVETSEFPAVVVEGGQSLPSPVESGHGTGNEKEGSRVPSAPAASAGGGAGPGAVTSGPQKKAERQLDLRSVALDAHEMPSTGRGDLIVQHALRRLLANVFGRGGEAAVLKTLKAEGKTPGDPADLWTMCRLLKIVGELSRRETEGLWLKFMPSAVAKAGEGGRVTFAGFLESVRAFEACLSRGELLGVSSTGREANSAGPLVPERSKPNLAPSRV